MGNSRKMKMSKIAIIGNGAGGKSTLSKKLSKSKGLPLYEVDKIQWKPNWMRTGKDELERVLQELVQKDLWILDGWGPWHSIEQRFEEADTIIFVDFPLWIHFWWAFKRQVTALFFPGRLDTPEGCNLARVTWKMFQTIWRVHKNMKPRLTKLVQSYKTRKEVFHIRSPREWKRFQLQHCS